MPQLKDASTKRDRPAITTHNHDNHGIRTENWRYIRYADGSEELYNMKKDPHEWNNLLAAGSGKGDPTARAQADKLARWIPKVNRKPASRSAHRVLSSAWQDLTSQPAT